MTKHIYSEALITQESHGVCEDMYLSKAKCLKECKKEAEDHLKDLIEDNDGEYPCRMREITREDYRDGLGPEYFFTGEFAGGYIVEMQVGTKRKPDWRMEAMHFVLEYNLKD